MPRPLRRAISAGLVTLLATAGVVGLGAAAAQAEVLDEFGGSLEAGDPTWQRPESCDDATPEDDFAQYYDAQTITPERSGGYVITMTEHTLTNGVGDLEADGYFYLYQGAFDPADPTANCIARNDDGAGGLLPQIEVALQAGVSYTLVTTQYGNPADESVYEYQIALEGVFPVPVLTFAADQPRSFTESAPVRIVVTFSEPVTGFDADDVLVQQFDGGEPLAATVTGSGADYVIETEAPIEYGAYGIGIQPGAALSVDGEVETQASNFVEFFYLESVATPTVTVVGATTVTVAPAVFTVTFSEPVEGLEASDIVVGGTAGATTIDLTGEGTTYTVTVGGFAQAGTIEVTVPEGAAYVQLPGGEGGGPQAPSAASNTAVVTYAPVVAPEPTTPAPSAPAPSAPAPTVAPAPGAGGTLPETGAEPGWLLALAAVMLVAVGAVAARRGARDSR